MLRHRLCCLLVCAIFYCAFPQNLYYSVNGALLTQSSSTPDLTGIDLFEKGDDAGAIKALRAVVKQDKTNVRAWHYLGLAFERQGKISDARKAHEKAAKLGDALLDALLLKMSGGYAPSFYAEIHEPLSLAATSAQKYIAISGKLSQSSQEEWNYRVESLQYFKEWSDPKRTTDAERRIFTGKEVTTKARILSKQEPQYPDEARQKNITGTVVLSVIFAADGKVRAIRPIKVLPNGLTQSAIDAARQIRFTPAMVDGKPVSMILRVEYNFNSY